jgi:hypothetical protein
MQSHDSLSAGQSLSRPRLRLELFIASLLPVTAILFVGVLGVRQMSTSDARFFIVIFFISALAIFCAEFTLLYAMQRKAKLQILDMASVCQDYLAGKRERRAAAAGNTDAAFLAGALNQLLDSVASGPQKAEQAPRDSSMLGRHLKKLILDITPLLSGDLRARAEVGSDDVGVVADICNRLIEELTGHIKEIHYVTSRIMQANRQVQEYSRQFIQTAETQHARLAQTIEAVEMLVAFIQRMSSTLQANVDLSRELQAQLPQKTILLIGTGEHAAVHKDDPPTGDVISDVSIRARMRASMKQQATLLDEVLQETQQQVIYAESMIGDLYSFAHEWRQSGTNIVSITKSSASLAEIAQKWLASLSAFKLLEEDLQEVTTLEKEAAQDPARFV